MYIVHSLCKLCNLTLNYSNILLNIVNNLNDRIFLIVALSIVVNLLSNDYKFYVPKRYLEKCESLDTQMSYGISLGLTHC